MKLELNKDYTCSNGDTVKVMSTATNDVGRQMYFGVRIIEDGAVSVETYTEEGLHYWNCDLDIVETDRDPIYEEKPWHMP